MLALRLLLIMISFASIRGQKDFDFRWQLATAITDATDDIEEQNTLTKIAWYESGFRRSVARCEVKGDNGKSHGTFQVQPMTPQDRKAVCGSLPKQVEVALRYVRRSAEMCPENRNAAKLNLYVSGRCNRGGAAAQLRWGGETKP